MSGSNKDPEQHRRFVEAARELGCDESEEAFERVFTRIVPPHRPGAALPHKPEPAPPSSGRGRPRKRG